MDKIPFGTKVILNDPYKPGGEFEVIIIAHVPGYDSARVAFEGDTDDYTVRRFSTRYVRTV